MLIRFVFIMMLMLAGWMPFQSVAAWRTMNGPEASEPASAMTDHHSPMMSDSCLSPVSSCGDNMAAGDHHSMQCAYCVSIYGGVSSLPELKPQGSQRHHGSLPLYDDHIPVVLSPPPVIVIA